MRVFREIGTLSCVRLPVRVQRRASLQVANYTVPRDARLWHTHANLPATSVALERIDRRNAAWKQYASGPLG